MHRTLSFLPPNYLLKYEETTGLQIGPYTFNSLSKNICHFLNIALRKGLDKKEIHQAFSNITDATQALYVLELVQKIDLTHVKWVHQDEKLLSFFLPQSETFKKKIDLNKILSISRFTALNWEDGECYLHSALSTARLIIHSQKIIQLIFLLTKEIKYEDLIKKTELSEATCEDFIHLLYQMKILNVDEDLVLKQWETHDLLYHKQSRCKSIFWKTGATFRFKGAIDAESAIKKISSDTTISLYKPNIQDLFHNDITLTEALETRKSSRDYSKTINDKELGEFLYRAARVKSTYKNNSFELIKANYPSGGSIYETEINLIIHECSGLEQGVYHYDRERHSLSKLSDLTNEARLLLTSAKHAAVKKSDIQILFVFTSRFQRLAWKYEGMAYSVMLKNVGVIMQTFYLTATAMRLSASSIGFGDAKLSSKVFKTNFFQESSLGEFILGG